MTAGIGERDTGGADVCVAKIERHESVMVSFSFSFLLFLFFFAMLAFFSPDPVHKKCELVYYTSKRENEIETDGVSLFAHPRALSRFLLNVQTLFSDEGPMLLPLRIFRFLPSWMDTCGAATHNYSSK